MRVLMPIGIGVLFAAVLALPSSAATRPGGSRVESGPFQYIAGLVTSASMEPTIHCANRNDPYCGGAVADLLVEDFSGARFVRRGDIIAYREPAAAAKYCVDKPGVATHRVIGVGGDRVSVQDGVVTLNGRRLNESYVPTSERGGRSGTWLVPRGSFFVLGDNRVYACDSRYYGAVSRASVLGRVVEIVRDAAGGSDPDGPPIVHVKYPYKAMDAPSGTMAPTMRCAKSGDPRDCTARFDDLALVELSGSRFLKRGTIVSFNEPQTARRYCDFGTGLGRVIGLPGETVSERGGIVSIDGRELHEPYVAADDRGGSVHGSWHVPPGSVFVLDDYRRGLGSCDSHIWGPLPVRFIRGRVTEVFRTTARS
jgi:signal peptidase I